jgi:cardiolipin synthase
MNLFVTIGFILLAVLGVTLLAIGALNVIRGTPIRAIGEQDDPTGCPAIHEPFFAEAIELFTGTVLTPGHEVTVLLNGDQTYPRLWEDLRSATSSITLQMYYCNAGHMADTLQEILIERARAGVKIYFLYDSFGTSLPKAYFKTLRDAGVETESFRPFRLSALQKVPHRAHIRVVVVDGRIGYTGGFGIDDKWYGDGRTNGQWRETNVRFAGHSVRQLQATFAVCWAEASGRLLTGHTLFPPSDRPSPVTGVAASASPGAETLAAVLHASPTIGSTPAERFFALSIAAARTRLYITNSYFVPVRTFRNLLCDAAKRGVDVRVLTTGKNTDVKSTWYAGRARYRGLLEAGVRIYEYQPSMMHAKTLVVDDGWLTIGSMNADNRSMSFNDESNLLVLDHAAAGKLAEIFLGDLDHAEEMCLDDFSKRPWHTRCAELGCHLMWRVL